MKHRPWFWLAILYLLGMVASFMAAAVWHRSPHDAPAERRAHVEHALAEMAAHPDPHQPAKADLDRELDAMRARSGDPHLLRLKVERRLHDLQREQSEKGAPRYYTRIEDAPCLHPISLSEAGSPDLFVCDSRDGLKVTGGDR